VRRRVHGGITFAGSLTDHFEFRSPARAAPAPSAQRHRLPLAVRAPRSGRSVWRPGGVRGPVRPEFEGGSARAGRWRRNPPAKPVVGSHTAAVTGQVRRSRHGPGRASRASARCSEGGRPEARRNQGRGATPPSPSSTFTASAVRIDRLAVGGEIPVGGPDPLQTALDHQQVDAFQVPAGHDDSPRLVIADEEDPRSESARRCCGRRCAGTGTTPRACAHV